LLKQKYRKLYCALVLTMLVSLLQPIGAAYGANVQSLEGAYGQVLDTRSSELGLSASYTWSDMIVDGAVQKVHTVEFDPSHSNLKLVAATKSGKVTGMEAMTDMAAYIDGAGSRVIAGINGDFYDISGHATGVPSGLFIGEGRILNSGSSSFAFGLKSDGTSIYGKPVLSKTITVTDSTYNLTSINRYRENNQLVLYTTDYAAATNTSAQGAEAVLEVLEGEVKSGSTMRLRVSELRLNQGNAPLADGFVVLSASGTSMPIVEGLAVGDEITASFGLAGDWQDVVVAIGGQGPLVLDGVAQTNVTPAGIHPRTAIGTKADGSIIMFEVDGRQPGFSEGLETHQVAKLLVEMGVVNAMNLDGGGSSTFIAKLPGTTKAQMLNSGSDGFERRVGNGLLLVNTAPELGTASRLAVTPNTERVLAGSTLQLKAGGLDANDHPAAIEGNVEWQADAALGTIDGNGLFTAGSTAGEGSITARAGSAAGTSKIEVIDRLTELKFPDAVKTYASGDVITLQVTALRAGQIVQASNDSLEWSVEGDIGIIDDHGVFTATEQSGMSGKIVVRHGDVQTFFEVQVGVPPVMLEDFENGLDAYKYGSAAAVKVDIEETFDQDYVRNGNAALKLIYNFTGTTGTSGAYLQSKSEAQNIEIPGYPEKIGMWVYGDGNTHWLRAQLLDGNKSKFPIDFTDQSVGVDWIGWRYVEAAVPQGKAPPLTMDMPVRYMETKNDKKDSGAIYIDDIRAIYGPLNEDHEPPVITSIYPLENAMLNDATPDITITAEDAGYDPVLHPGTTLINPDSIRLYIDGQQVNFGFYPPAGRISYTPTEPLSEGRHHVKIAVRDLEGNQTIKEWYFKVNLGSPYYEYDLEEEQLSGLSYTFDLSAVDADRLSAGLLEIAYTPNALMDIALVPHAKLDSSQVQLEVDEKQALLRLKLSNLTNAGLEANDLLAQISYKVNPNVLGPFNLEQLASNPTSKVKLNVLTAIVEIADEEGKSVNFSGDSIEATIKPSFKLTWNPYATALGQEASFAIVDAASGEAIEGAKLLLDGNMLADASSNAEGIAASWQAARAAGTYTLQAVKDNHYSALMEFVVAPHAGTELPSNINVTMGNDATTSRRLTWHTKPSVDQTIVDYVKKEEFAGFEADNVIRLTGASSLYTTNNDGTIRVHKAELVGLEPGTEYVYRVGDGASLISPQGVLQTSDSNPETTKFLFFGDSQADKLVDFELWGETMKAAVQDMPDAELLVHAGDMVDKGYEQEQWNWWFEVTKNQLMNKTLIPIIGNHEVMGNNGNGDYLAQFNNPSNGSDAAKGTSFSYDIGDTHFVVLNTEMGAEGIDEQAAWLQADLEQSEKKWTIVFFHQGPYGSIYSNEKVQSTWVPIFDQYGVDLVMNGHDHIYMRTYTMNNGKAVEAGEAGTVYMIGGSSGPKFYGLTARPWQDVVFEGKKQIYSKVEVTEEQIEVIVKSKEGEEVDRFVITKPTVTPEPSETPEPTPTAPESGIVKIGASQLTAAGSEIVLTIDQELNKLQLPGNAAELLNNRSLTIKAANLSVVIPASALKQWSEETSAGQLANGTIIIQLDSWEDSAEQQLLKQLEAAEGAELTSLHSIKGIKLFLTTAEKKVIEAVKSDESIQIAVKAEEEWEAAITGLYEIMEDGKLRYAGGRMSDGLLTVAMPIEGSFIILSYEKQFADVPVKHWAYDTIRELAAKGLVNGISKERFSPEGKVTRAEFTAMLARLLGLEQKSQISFTDVASDSWYTDAVAAAVQAGIVNGKSASAFEPLANIKREEMAVMLMRAYAFARSQEAGEFGSVPFTDMNQASDWAQAAIAAAYGSGLIKGRSADQFDPAGQGTRAESSQLLLNLLEAVQ